MIPIFRALHNNCYYPAKIISSQRKKTCSFAHNGIEIEKKRFEVLSGGHEWIQSPNGRIPGRATYAGRNEEDQKMYIGRAKHDGYYIPGTVNITYLYKNSDW